LLHDDVVDESDMRRSMPTANRLFGNKASILVGDFLLSRAFSIMVKDGSLEVLRILSEASAIIAEGEVMQLVHEGDISITFEDYRQIIAAKTAQLFAASCEIGGALIEDAKIQNNLSEFGMNLGLAFQILDDCLDYTANEILLGKRTGDDLRDKKITLPVILCLQVATHDEQSFIKKLFDKNENIANDDEYHQILELMQKYDIVSKCEDIARQYAEKAEIALSRLPNGLIRNILQETLEFCIMRGY
jgi:octaprenyl-diphosphate synthase